MAVDFTPKLTNFYMHVAVKGSCFDNEGKEHL